MRLKVVRLVILAAIVSSLLISTVYAFGSLNVSPPRIPQGEKVTIVFTSSGTNRIDKIEVTGPDGTIYVKDYNPDQIFTDGQQLIEEFGTGIGGWTPSADTSKEGWYKVVLIGYEPPYRQEDYFDVSRQFYVPEFALPSIILTVVGFALFNVKHRITKKNLRP